MTATDLLRTVTITLPQPSPDIAGNDRAGHWQVRARLRKRAKQDAYLAARSVMNRQRGAWEPWTPVVVTYRWFLGYRQRAVDVDNAVARMKPGLDGLVEAGLIAGDSPKHVHALQVEYARDWNDPRVEVVVERVGGR